MRCSLIATVPLLLLAGCKGFFTTEGAPIAVCAGGSSAPPLSRLNTHDIDESLARMLDDSVAPARFFPADSIGAGHFDNDATQLKISPALVQGLEEVSADVIDAAWARDLALSAGGTSSDGMFSVTLNGVQAQTSTGGSRGQEWNLWSNGEAIYRYNLPREGSYLLELSVYGDQVAPDPVKMDVWINGVMAQSFDITATQAQPVLLTVTRPLSPGALAVGLRFINDYRDQANNRDRNLLIRTVAVKSQQAGTSTGTAAKPKLLLCQPKAAGEERACVEQMVTAFARHAWRRPTTSDELASILAVYEGTRVDGDDYVTAAKLALRTVISSPSFLLRTESVMPADGAASTWAMASRLSFFLWGGPPDEVLEGLADAQTLADPAVVDEQIARMMADPRSEALMNRFVMQWYGVTEVEGVSLDAALFPGVDGAVMKGMHLQVEAYLREFFLGDRDVLDALDAPVTFVDTPLAAFLGMSERPSTLSRVTLPAGDDRSGLLGKSATLVVTSKSTETNPPRRGNYIQEHIFCEPMPLPIGLTIPPVPQASAESPTARDRLESLTSDQTCQGCHAVLNPLGFGLENFAADSRFRTTDHGANIQAAGVLRGQAFSKPAELSAIIRRDPRAEACIVQKTLSYALARPLSESGDPASLGALTTSFSSADHRFTQLVRSVARSTALSCR